jgi:hypothetical protein
MQCTPTTSTHNKHPQQAIDTTKSIDYALSTSVGEFMKGWRYALLIFELFLFALILVLPQVDLPDFTFRAGTAPIAAKARLSSAPVLSIVVAPGVGRSFEPVGETRTPPIQTAVYLNPLPPLSLSSTLRC